MLWFFKYFGAHLLLTIWSSFFKTLPINDESPVIAIPALGNIRGAVKLSENGRKYNSYRGIPYAEPPIGELRFKDPVPVVPWSGELDATREGPVCAQYFPFLHITFGVEDCLKLNVYSPVSAVEENLLPVMVWIHGGGFVLGNGNGEYELYGPERFMDRDIILVTINYRLGPLGFLSTEDAEAPGNYGLLDQSLALKWVRDHIENFGGDPNSITIFGESAGGASVEFQMLSPYNKGVFHRAIIQSGSATAPWALQSAKGKLAHYTKELAKHAGCPVDSSSKLISCLKTKNALEIADFKRRICLPLGHELFPNPFVPRIDSEREKPFLPDHPLELIASGRFNPVPFISGANENEGVIFSMSLFVNRGQAAESFRDDPITNLKYFLNMETSPEGDQVARQVFNHYLNENQSYIAQHKQFEQMFSDIEFFLSIDRATKAFSRNSPSPVYRYHYVFKGFMSLPRMVGFSPYIDFGVSHADENFLMFKCKLAPPMSNEDAKTSTTLIDLWTSFAKTGIPSSSFLMEEWLPFHPDEQEKNRYLLIGDAPTVVVGDMPFSERLKMLKRLLKASS